MLAVLTRVTGCPEGMSAVKLASTQCREESCNARKETVTNLQITHLRNTKKLTQTGKRQLFGKITYQKNPQYLKVTVSESVSYTLGSKGKDKDGLILEIVGRGL